MRLVYIALGWIAGIVVAADERFSIAPVIWLIACGLTILAAWFFRRFPLRLPLIIIAVFALGGLRFALFPNTSALAQYNNVGGLTIEGVVVDEPDVRDDRVNLRVAAETVTRGGQTIAVEGLVLVQSPPIIRVRYGDRVTATGDLITPNEIDTFSYADFLAREGVYSIMTNTAVEILSSGHGSPLFAALIDMRTRAQAAIESYLPEPQASLLSGIILGDENSIAPDVRDAFASAGASHIIAISGFNMVIVGEVTRRFLERARVGRRLTLLLVIAVLLVYTLFVGAGTSVVRAAVMSSVLLVGGLMRRKGYVPATLAFTVLLMSVANPTVLWDISFQLSFFAVLGLALFGQPLSVLFGGLSQRSGSVGRVFGGFVFEPLAVTIAAQALTLPLSALYFHSFSLLTLPANLLVLPVQPALMGVGALATVTDFVPALAQALYWLDLVLLAWMTGVVRWFAALPAAQVELYVSPNLVALFFVAVVGVAMTRAAQPTWAQRLGRLISRRSVVSATLFAGLATLILIVALVRSRPDGLLHVWFLDNGHSNAVLMQTPNGAHILIDGGRFPARLLTALGDRLPFNDRQIEVLVVTQPDANEFGALTTVLERYHVGVALMNGQSNLGEPFAALQSALANGDVEVVTVGAGYSLDVDDGLRLDVLHPRTPPQITDSLDEGALVLRVVYDEASFLLTSDVSAEGQAELLATGQWPLATVLQLPQHGRARSLDAEFLAAVQPQVVVLQSDVSNRLGDPDPDTLAQLGDTSLYRTDQGGTIHIWTDGRELWVQQETSGSE
ncbi:MAG: ComEC/Rec2 family competence protein [Burkholderiales bacterium]|nr:ComEC/Rec2 family competence protein [Anaerolineae bacterium]